MRKILLISVLAILPGAYANDSARQQLMSSMEYVDAQQCHIAVNSSVVSIMPILAQAWIESAGEARERARNAFAIALQRGCDINAADFNGLAALHHAILANDILVAEYLLQHGADRKRSIEGSGELQLDGLDSLALLDKLEASGAPIDSSAWRKLLQ